MITDEDVEKALDNEYDGVDTFDLVKELLAVKSSRDNLVTTLGHIDICLSIIKCTKGEEGLKGLSELAIVLKDYIELALKEAWKL